MARETVKVYLPEHPTTAVDGGELTKEEIIKLDQTLEHLSGGSPILRSMVFARREDFQNILSVIVGTENKPFTGMRRASNAIGAVVLHSKHIDTNMADWQLNPTTLSAAGWATRSNGSGTARGSSVTIADELWLVIIGIQTTHDVTNVIGTSYNVKPVACRYTYGGLQTLPIDFYSAGISGANNTRLVSCPTQYIAEKSTFTEEYWFPTSLTTNQQKFYVRDVGIAFGTGSVLANIL